MPLFHLVINPNVLAILFDDLSQHIDWSFFSWLKTCDNNNLAWSEIEAFISNKTQYKTKNHQILMVF